MQFTNLYGKTRLENTLDHWTPQHPDEMQHDEKFREKYLHNLGNMVLATRGRNSSDSNNLPNERSTVSTLISRQQFEGLKSDWNSNHIKARHQKITQFAKGYWNLEKI